MAERILLGHFLTRRDVAGLEHIGTDEVGARPDLLRIGGTWLEEVYFAFQFTPSGARPEVSRVVRDLHRRFDDEAIADWLARPNDHLMGLTPLHWLDTHRDEDRVIKASHDSGPVP